MNPGPLPRVLLVEDDVTSRAFLTAAVRALPADVDGADSIASAWGLAERQGYDLWLFDAHLPDGRGSDLLARLRRVHPDVPALAHTASTDRAVLDALIREGFAEVLVKPIPAATVQSAVRRMLGLAASDPAPIDAVRTDYAVGIRAAVDGADVDGEPHDGEPHDGADRDANDQRHVSREAWAKLPVWDDEAAARALNFQRTHIETLRGLFTEELPQVRERIVAAARIGDLETLQACLHRLRASCGFVGAARLGAAVQAMQKRPGDASWLVRFDDAAQDTLLQSGSARSA